MLSNKSIGVLRERPMRLTCALGAALLLCCAVPAISHAADLTATPEAAPGSANSDNTAVRQPAAACDAPVANPNARRRHRVVKHVYHRRWQRPPVVMMRPPPPPPLVIYNPPIPSPYDSAYDRGMLLHYLSPPVSGIYGLDPGLPTTPPIAGVQHYRLQVGEAVVQYDGITGEYIPLAQIDARRVLAAGPLPVLLPQ
jgi:hypothetical protein